jgi:hypothetical protein
MARGPTSWQDEVAMVISTFGVFDRVDVIEGDHARSFTPNEFLSLPLPFRIGSVIQGKCQFFRGDEPVEKQLALNELRRMAEPS